MGLITGFKAHLDSEEIHIIQYADDTLILLEAKAEVVDNIKAILLWFVAFAGLSMNMHKVGLYKVNVCEDRSEQMADWGCQ